MISDFKRLSELTRKITGRGERAERMHSTDLPLDHQLTFSPEPDQRWTYDPGMGVCVNDTDVRELVHDNPNDVGMLCGLSHGLYRYQQFVWSKGGKSNAQFNGAVNSLQHAVLGRLGNIYDTITGGMSVTLEGEDLWLNNINVRSVLKLYALRPTDAARCYLEGLRDKVGLILSRRKTSSKYDAVRDEAARIFDEINIVLSAVPSSGPPRLCA
ncbi:MAG: hypothetical protein JXA24_05820 [Proteobacteria bacterium]|nr:hypothetical protein [Pseudomonadota bacterium]